jgi:hypothetical protein
LRLKGSGSGSSCGYLVRSFQLPAGGHLVGGAMTGGESECQWRLVVVMQARTQKITSSPIIQPLPHAPRPVPQDGPRVGGRIGRPAGVGRDGGNGA